MTTYLEACATRTAKRTGVPLHSLLDRFFGNVRVEGECWIWTKTLVTKGYAPFYLTSTHSVAAHRWIYQLMIADIPAGLQLDHVREWGCTSRACVNPYHLEPVTNRENQRRGDHPTTGVAFRTNTCPQGHSLADAYLRKGKNGAVHRRCRPCQRTSYAAYLDRKRNAA